MVKQNIKRVLALLAQKFTKFCVYKGCTSQDEVIEKFSTYVDVKTKSKTMNLHELTLMEIHFTKKPYYQ